jgi:hypothetical protein
LEVTAKQTKGIKKEGVSRERAQKAQRSEDREAWQKSGDKSRALQALREVSSALAVAKRLDCDASASLSNEQSY